MRQRDAAAWKLIAAFAAVYLIWGSTYLAMRLAIDSIPPLLMLGGRFSAAGSLLFTVMLLAGAGFPDVRMWKNAFLIGTLTLGVGTGAVAWSELYVSTGVVALLAATVPLWIVLLEWKWKKGPSPNAAVVLGLFLGAIGIVLLVNPRAIFVFESFQMTFAMLVVLAGTLSWSYGSLLSRDVRLPDNPFMSTACQMLGGGIALIVAGLIHGEWASFSLEGITVRSWMALAYLLVFGSIIGFSSYVWLMKNALPGQVSTYAYVNPVVAVLLGWLFVGEVLTARIIAAMMVLVLAVILISRFGRRHPGGRSPVPKWFRKHAWLPALYRPTIEPAPVASASDPVRTLDTTTAAQD